MSLTSIEEAFSIPITTMNYKIGDILLLKPSYGQNKQVIVTGLNPNRPKNKYKLRINSNRASRTYIGSDSIIDCKVGEVAEDHPFLVEASNKPASPSPAGLWAIDRYVQSLKYGDRIMLNRSGRIEAHTFGRYLSKGRTYKFTATNRRGTSYKHKLESVHMVAIPDDAIV